MAEPTSATTTEEIEDEMITRASVPDLAALLKSAMDKGLITPSKGYAAA